MAVLRRGLADSPELRQGLRLTVLFAVLVAVGRLIDPGARAAGASTRACSPTRASGPAFTFAACGGAAVIVIGIALLSRVTYVRLVKAAEAMLRSLRVRAFTHVHRLPMADHDATRRGELTSRVTSDIETIARFAQYGGVAWIVDTVVITGTLALMAVYAWQLALVTLVLAAPVLPLFRMMQRRQLKAYEQVRSRVGETLVGGVRGGAGGGADPCLRHAAAGVAPPRRRDRAAVPGRDGSGQVVRPHVPARRRLRRHGPRRGHHGRRVVGPGVGPRTPAGWSPACSSSSSSSARSASSARSSTRPRPPSPVGRRCST